MNACHFKYKDQVLVVRCINADGKTYGGFKNPTTVGKIVEALDWNNKPVCGGGLHGWPWGISREGKSPVGNLIWQVYERLDKAVQIGRSSKAKFNRLRLLYSGNEAEAMRVTAEGRRAYCTSQSARFSNTRYRSLTYSTTRYSLVSNTGNSSLACSTARNSSVNNSGDYSSASNTGDNSISNNTGNCSSANNTGTCSSSSNTGNCSLASSTGNRSSVSNTGFSSSAINTGNYSSASSIGDSSLAACIGLGGKAAAGENGCIVLTYVKNGQTVLKCGQVGKRRKLKPGIWYTLDKNGRFIRCKT